MPEVNSADDCAQARHELGVYVLGAIGPGERAQVDRHLAVCPRCREELAGLAGLPGLLRRVPPDVATQAWVEDTSGSRPGPPLDRLISRMSAIRLRRRLTAAAAVLVIGLAAATGLQVLHVRLAGISAAAAPQWIETDTGDSPATGAWAAVRYAAQPWGAELEVRVTGIPVGTRCQLRVTNARDQDIAAGGWTITSGSQHTWYPASVPWPTGSLRGFDITAGGRTLVTVLAR
jgi:anti-sigma factor RsiW